MHFIEPYYNWRDYYTAEEDEHSPFYGRDYNEFEFEHSIYNYCIHPQWDYFGSNTLYLKILYADYENKFAIMEFLGEWNDCVNNDIMLLKRDVVDILSQKGINKFVLIGENVLNFHFDMDDYYAEWLEDVENGWIALINFQEHVLSEFNQFHLNNFLIIEDDLQSMNWRTYKPLDFFHLIDERITNKSIYFLENEE
jgi:hypothetical protein